MDQSGIDRTQNISNLSKDNDSIAWSQQISRIENIKNIYGVYQSSQLQKQDSSSHQVIYQEDQKIEVNSRNTPFLASSTPDDSSVRQTVDFVQNEIQNLTSSKQQIGSMSLDDLKSYSYFDLQTKYLQKQKQQINENRNQTKVQQKILLNEESKKQILQRANNASKLAKDSSTKGSLHSTLNQWIIYNSNSQSKRNSIKNAKTSFGFKNSRIENQQQQDYQQIKIKGKKGVQLGTNSVLSLLNQQIPHQKSQVVLSDQNLLLDRNQQEIKQNKGTVGFSNQFKSHMTKLKQESQTDSKTYLQNQPENFSEQVKLDNLHAYFGQMNRNNNDEFLSHSSEQKLLEELKTPDLREKNRRKGNLQTDNQSSRKIFDQTSQSNLVVLFPTVAQDSENKLRQETIKKLVRNAKGRRIIEKFDDKIYSGQSLSANQTLQKEQLNTLKSQKYYIDQINDENTFQTPLSNHIHMQRNSKSQERVILRTGNQVDFKDKSNNSRLLNKLESIEVWQKNKLTHGPGTANTHSGITRVQKKKVLQKNESTNNNSFLATPNQNLNDLANRQLNASLDELSQHQLRILDNQSAGLESFLDNGVEIQTITQQQNLDALDPHLDDDGELDFVNSAHMSIEPNFQDKNNLSEQTFPMIKVRKSQKNTQVKSNGNQSGLKKSQYGDQSEENLFSRLTHSQIDQQSSNLPSAHQVMTKNVPNFRSQRSQGTYRPTHKKISQLLQQQNYYQDQSQGSQEEIDGQLQTKDDEVNSNFMQKIMPLSIVDDQSNYKNMSHHPSLQKNKIELSSQLYKPKENGKNSISFPKLKSNISDQQSEFQNNFRGTQQNDETHSPLLDHSQIDSTYQEDHPGLENKSIVQNEQSDAKIYQDNEIRQNMKDSNDVRRHKSNQKDGSILTEKGGISIRGDESNPFSGAPKLHLFRKQSKSSQSKLRQAKSSQQQQRLLDLKYSQSQYNDVNLSNSILQQYGQDYAISNESEQNFNQQNSNEQMAVKNYSGIRSENNQNNQKKFIQNEKKKKTKEGHVNISAILKVNQKFNESHNNQSLESLSGGIRNQSNLYIDYNSHISNSFQSNESLNKQTNKDQSGLSNIEVNQPILQFEYPSNQSADDSHEEWAQNFEGKENYSKEGSSHKKNSNIKTSPKIFRKDSETISGQNIINQNSIQHDQANSHFSTIQQQVSHVNFFEAIEITSNEAAFPKSKSAIFGLLDNNSDNSLSRQPSYNQSNNQIIQKPYQEQLHQSPYLLENQQSAQETSQIQNNNNNLEKNLRAQTSQQLVRQKKEELSTIETIKQKSQKVPVSYQHPKVSKNSKHPQVFKNQNKQKGVRPLNLEEQDNDQNYNNSLSSLVKMQSTAMFGNQQNTGIEQPPTMQGSPKINQGQSISDQSKFEDFLQTSVQNTAKGIKKKINDEEIRNSLDPLKIQIIRGQMHKQNSGQDNQAKEMNLTMSKLQSGQDKLGQQNLSMLDLQQPQAVRYEKFDTQGFGDKPVEDPMNNTQHSHSVAQTPCFAETPNTTNQFNGYKIEDNQMTYLSATNIMTSSTGMMQIQLPSISNHVQVITVKTPQPRK